MQDKIKKNKTFALACLSVGASSVFQYFILLIMRNDTTEAQTFACFIQDLLLFLLFDILRNHFKNKNNEN